MTGSGLIRRAVFVLVIGFSPVHVFADAFDWLMKINKAAADINFVGTLVYTSNGEIKIMEVVRRIQDGLMQERIYSLNGEPREIIRNKDKVWRYIPDQNMVIHDYRQATKSGFPRILPDDLDQLRKNYGFEEGEEERIADRMAITIKVTPDDAWRYGYTLWADKQSGLLLRSDLISQDGEVIGQYLFADIEINGFISDAQLAPVSSAEKLRLFGNSEPMPESSESSDWSVTELPDGYQLNNHIRRMSPMGKGELEHFVYSDGLSSLSVFIKETSQDQGEMTGLSRMGAVHAYRTRVGHYLVTVMGEVPPETVKAVARGVQPNAG